MAITVAAGSVLTATVYNSNVPLYLAQGSDQNLTTAPANWNAGAMSFDASGVWECRGYFDYNTSVAANNFQLTWQTPTGGATIGRIYHIGGGPGATGAVLNFVDATFSSRPASSTLAHAGATGTSNRSVMFMSFIVTTTTAGTIIPQVSTSAGTGILYTGSFVVAHRLT